VYPVTEVAVRGDGRVRDPRDEHTILFARRGLGLLAEIFHGDGVVVLLPEADILTNRGLAKADNVELVASLIADWIEPGTEVWFDEYHHGARVAGSILAYLAQRRPGLFAAAFLAAGVLAVMRWGRALLVRPEAETLRRRRPTEFVDALASLYSRSRAVAPAWGALAKTAERYVGDTRGGHPGPLGGLTLVAMDREKKIADLRHALSTGRPVPTENDLVGLAVAVAQAVEPPGGKERR